MWETVVALLALALSIFALVRGELRDREANFIVTWEHHPATGKRSFGHEEIVIHNAGPAFARDVRWRFTNRDGSEAEERLPMMDRDRGEGGIEAIPVLPPLHDVRFTWVRALGESEPEAATVTWRDGRRGRQTLIAPLSRRMLHPPAVHVEVDARPPEPPPRGGGRGTPMWR